MEFPMHAVHVCIVLAALAGQGEDRGARSIGVLAVAPPPGPGPELVEITVQLRERTAEYHLGVLDVRQLRERMTGQLAGASLAELDRAFEGARVAYLRGDYEGSVRTLRTVVEGLEKLPDGADAFAQWTRVMLRLARSELNLGQEEAARASIERLVRAAPEVEVDRTLYPASFANEVEKARTALKTAATHPLTVSSSAAGARVYLNGRDVGTAPLTLALPRGTYKLSGGHGTLLAGPLFVELGDEDQEVFLDFTIPEALRPGAGPGLALLDEDRSRWIVAAGAHLRLDEFLAVSLVEEGGARHVVGSLYDVRRGMLVREARVRLSNGSVPVGGSSALAEFLVTGQARSGLVEVPGEPRAAVSLAVVPPTPAVSDLRHLHTSGPPRRFRTLRWVTFGTGIAAVGLGVVGIVEVRSASDSYDRARQLQRTLDYLDDSSVTTYNRHVTEGDAARRNAAVAWVGAGVSALATGVLGYWQYRRTGEFGPFRF
jgi:hypothetical protein